MTINYRYRPAPPITQPTTHYDSCHNPVNVTISCLLPPPPLFAVNTAVCSIQPDMTRVIPSHQSMDPYAANYPHRLGVTFQRSLCVVQAPDQLAHVLTTQTIRHDSSGALATLELTHYTIALAALTVRCYVRKRCKTSIRCNRCPASCNVRKRRKTSMSCTAYAVLTLSQ